MCFCSRVFCLRKERSGQATLEAAYLIPIFFVLLLLLIQPGILLYNMMVMNGAAAQGCRALMTKPQDSAETNEAYENFIRRRLSSIPQESHFHLHEGACSYEIICEGDESSLEVKVTIRNEVTPLPLLGLGAELLGLTNEQGNFTQEVSVSMPTVSPWVTRNDLGMNRQAWVEQ